MSLFLGLAPERVPDSLQKYAFGFCRRFSNEPLQNDDIQSIFLFFAGQATKKEPSERLLCVDKGASALNEPICISVVCVGFSVSSPALPTAFLHGSAPACVFCLYYNRIFL